LASIHGLNRHNSVQHLSLRETLILVSIYGLNKHNSVQHVSLRRTFRLASIHQLIIQTSTCP
jgi:hypothetical protein